MLLLLIRTLVLIILEMSFRNPVRQMKNEYSNGVRMIKSPTHFKTLHFQRTLYNSAANGQKPVVTSVVCLWSLCSLLECFGLRWSITADLLSTKYVRRATGNETSYYISGWTIIGLRALPFGRHFISYHLRASLISRHLFHGQVTQVNSWWVNAKS